ncbi:cardiolipin synthase [Zafaria sp. J156]|uniref:cardiolipin synthase n=1 Tax=Zafaria sp. J156 TaxID=3116490 RepID=UPI002E773318|nr:cardiolipin synthase [Zafaria sp. J156]MEE1620179.1 cardiolipin synthase [Zafaria sp. J156]
MAEWWDTVDLLALLALVLHLLLGSAAAVYVSANRRPSAAIAWVMAIIFIPFLGTLAYGLVGRNTLPRHRREKQEEVNALVLERTEGLSLASHRDEWPAWLGSAAALSLNLGALPMVGGNRAVLLDDYEAVFAAVARDIDGARTQVHVEFYILVRDGSTQVLFDALARAAARGVAVRVLSDHLAGLMYPGRRDTEEFLRAAGIQWHPMLPFRPLRGDWQRPDLRNHRKLVVVDGRIGYTGSQNAIDAGYHKKPARDGGRLSWHELMVRLEGPVVRELDAVFVTDWYSETGTLLPLDTSPVVLSGEAADLDAQILPSGPSFPQENNLKLYALLIHQARHRVGITSPYFVPEESILLAILTAAARGVEVELFVSEIGDQALVHHAQRSYYEALLRAGVRIHLYRAPQVLHAKHFTIDDDVAVIGSSNMDIRSFSLNMEVSVMLHGRGLVDDVRRIQDGYRAASRELVLGDWLQRPLGQKVRDNLARLTSSLQ